jgi:hypothetical protein
MSSLNVRNEIVIQVASTGIAITLLAGGRTNPSQFKFPIPLEEISTSNMRPNSEVTKLLKKATLINWDEATMAVHYALNAVHRLPEDLINHELQFGGKVILLDIDFRRCPPILKHVSRTVD